MPKRADKVSAALIRARLALRRGEDPELADRIDGALRHRAASLASSSGRVSAPPPDMRIVKAIEHLVANIADRRLTISALAGAAGLSTFHFARRFSEVTGSPPRAYLRQKRLELAREMLVHRQNLSLVDVALKSGFASQSHLNASFKDEYGIAPGQFRKQGAQARRRR
jgi:AraC-like DNA-binding protein